MGRPFKSNLPKELASALDRIGANLRELREARGLTQAAVAEVSKVSTTTINQLESQRCRDVRLSTMVALAKALGCQVESLFAGTDIQLTTRDHARLLRASEDILRIVKKIPSDD